mmetsp:Transcript_12926/g.24010  ORF Transcript_12926/g.24010 Transcript_12926/m.24010 type:complete len:140 (+) Transcript_12926:193-612(+)
MGDLNIEEIQQGLVRQVEWAKAVIFDNSGAIIASTLQVNPAELQAYLRALDSRDDTIGAGFIFCGEHFDVHRFHPPLVYGRRGGPDEGEGIALCQAHRDGRPYYGLITYTYPILSARAVPQLIDFCRRHVGSVEIPPPS